MSTIGVEDIWSRKIKVKADNGVGQSEDEKGSYEDMKIRDMGSNKDPFQQQMINQCLSITKICSMDILPFLKCTEIRLYISIGQICLFCVGRRTVLSKQKLLTCYNRAVNR